MALIKATSEGVKTSANEMGYSHTTIDGIIVGMIDIADDMPFYADSASAFRMAIDDWAKKARTILADLNNMADNLNTVGNTFDITEINNIEQGTFF